MVGNILSIPSMHACGCHTIVIETSQQSTFKPISFYSMLATILDNKPTYHYN